MPTGGRKDPLAGYHFFVEIDSVQDAFFRECSGLDSETEIIETKAVNDKGETIIMKLPGKLKWSNITLKRGITNDMKLWDWRKKVEEGKIKDARKSGSIVVCDYDGTEIARYNFKEAWPSKLTGPAVNATGADVAVEEIVLVHEGLMRVK
jgi:phage tail-like protein